MDGADAGPAAESLEYAEGLIEHVNELKEDIAMRLMEALMERFPAAEREAYGAGFNMMTEVTDQIVALRALRTRVLTDTGLVRAGVTARELKEVVAASNSMLQTLMKTHERIVNYDRMRAIEEATIEAIKELPDEVKQQFFAKLEQLLEEDQ